MQVCTVYVYVAITFRSVVLFIYKMTYNVLRDVKKYHTIYTVYGKKGPKVL